MSKHPFSIKIDIWSDVACPWCYLGKRRLDRAMASFHGSSEALPVEIEYHSYQLNPDLPADYEGNHSEYLQSRLGMSPAKIAASNRTLAEMGEAVGAECRMDRVVISSTAKANELLQFAKAHGKQAELKERLFRDYWTEERRLGRIDELEELAREVGLDREAVHRSLKVGEFAGAVRSDLDEARAYVATTLERFANSFLDHRFTDIADNHEEKIRRRAVAFFDWSRGHGDVRPKPRLRALAAGLSLESFA